MAYSTPGLLTEESRWLAKLVRMQRMAIHSSTISNGLSANTPMQHDLLSSESLTLATSTYRSVSFSVISGSVSVSMDGGSTSISYPVGSNINMTATDTLDMSFVFTVPGVLNDGENRVIVQTISA